MTLWGYLFANNMSHHPFNQVSNKQYLNIIKPTYPINGKLAFLILELSLRQEVGL